MVMFLMIISAEIGYVAVFPASLIEEKLTIKSTCFLGAGLVLISYLLLSFMLDLSSAFILLNCALLLLGGLGGSLVLVAGLKTVMANFGREMCLLGFPIITLYMELSRTFDLSMRASMFKNYREEHFIFFLAAV